MKKTLLQTKNSKELKKLKRVSKERSKARIKLAEAELFLMVLNEHKNAARREIYRKYKDQLKKANAEVEYWRNILINS